MLTIDECQYPNGATYGVFYIGKHEIGAADKIDDGWRPFGKRKALSSERAAKVMIDKSISRARKDEAHAREMLEALRLHCGGSCRARSDPAIGGNVGWKATKVDT